MVSEQINFRRAVAAGVAVRLAHRNQKAGRLTGGLFSFPDGCNNAVQVRILISSPSLGGIRQVTPIANAYIALNDANWEFTLDEAVLKDDLILVDIRNTGAEAHTISVVVTRQSEEKTQVEHEAAERKAKVEQSKKGRRFGH